MLVLQQTLKHFPGYGSAIDTHTDFAVVTKSKADFEKEDLLPLNPVLQQEQIQ